MKIPPSIRQTAFSLVEVTMALGIVATAFVTLFGLLPLGLQSFHNSIDTLVRAQILQELAAQAHQTEFQNLATLASPSAATPVYHFFDSEGVRLAETEKSSSVYTAAVTYEPASSLPTALSSNSLATVKIKILNNRGIFTQDGAPADVNPTASTLLLADFGQRL